MEVEMIFVWIKGRFNMLGCLVLSKLVERNQTCWCVASAETEAEAATQFTFFNSSAPKAGNAMASSFYFGNHLQPRRVFLDIRIIFWNFISMGLGLTLMVTTWMSFGWAQEKQPISSKFHQQGNPLCGKAARTPAQKKISSHLLYELKKRRGDVISHEFETPETIVEVDSNGETLVDIKAEVNETVLSRIQALGGKVITSFAQYQAIRARIPIEKIEVLAELPELIFIRPAERPITN